MGEIAQQEGLPLRPSTPEFEIHGTDNLPGKGMWLVSFREHKAWLQLHWVKEGHYTGKVFWQGEWITANKFSEMLGDTWKNWKKTVGVENFGFDGEGAEILSTPRYNNGDPIAKGKVAIEAVCESFNPPVFLKRKTWAQQARHRAGPATPCHIASSATSQADAHAVLKLKQELLRRDDSPAPPSGLRESCPVQAQASPHTAKPTRNRDENRHKNVEDDDGSETEEDTPQALSKALSSKRSSIKEERGDLSRNSSSKPQSRKRQKISDIANMFGVSDLHLPVGLEGSPDPRRIYDGHHTGNSSHTHGSFQTNYLNAHFTPLSQHFAPWNGTINGQHGSPSGRAPPIFVPGEHKSSHSAGELLSPIADIIKEEVEKWKGKCTGLQKRVQDLELESDDLKRRLAEVQTTLDRVKRDPPSMKELPSGDWRMRYSQWVEQGRHILDEVDMKRSTEDSHSPTSFA